MKSSASGYVFYTDSTFSSGEPRFQVLSSQLWDKTAPDDTYLPNLPLICWALPSHENLTAALNLVLPKVIYSSFRLSSLFPLAASNSTSPQGYCVWNWILTRLILLYCSLYNILTFWKPLYIFCLLQPPSTIFVFLTDFLLCGLLVFNLFTWSSLFFQGQSPHFPVVAESWGHLWSWYVSKASLLLPSCIALPFLLPPPPHPTPFCLWRKVVLYLEVTGLHILAILS